MVNPNRFYTYAYLREDKTPYYIGKGSANRLFCRSKKDIRPPKDKTRVIFLKQNLTEEEAFRHEIYMISVFGRKDLGTGILHNRTDGGDGCSGVIRSEEHKKKISEFHKGKKMNEELQKRLIKLSKQRIGEKNHFYGKFHNEEVKKIMSEKAKERGGKHLKGLKVWNNGIKCIRSKEFPGEGWVSGFLLSDEEREKIKNRRKKLNLNNKYSVGYKWWSKGNECIRSKGCPGEGWINKRLYSRKSKNE